MGEKDYDPMMHTAEHLVNGTIARMLGRKTRRAG